MVIGFRIDNRKLYTESEFSSQILEGRGIIFFLDR